GPLPHARRGSTHPFPCSPLHLFTSSPLHLFPCSPPRSSHLPPLPHLVHLRRHVEHRHAFPHPPLFPVLLPDLLHDVEVQRDVELPPRRRQALDVLARRDP